MDQNTKIYKRYAPDRDVVLHNGDCIPFLKTLPNSSLDLTVTSPPYCMGKEYESTKDYDHFLEIHDEILPLIAEKTKLGGSICWQVGLHVNNAEVMPLDFLVHSIISKIPGLHLRNRIVWTFGHGLHSKKRFSGRYETILWYTKGDDYTFNLDAVRVAQKYPGKTHYKGDKKGIPSGNPLGKNPGNVWEFPCVNANHIEKTTHPCQFPIALAQRLILGLTNSGDTVLDPFMGSGTTACASVLGDRKFIGCELSEDYYPIAVKRCKKALSGNLKYRPLDKPVEIPNPNSKVATNPFILN